MSFPSCFVLILFLLLCPFLFPVFTYFIFSSASVLALPCAMRCAIKYFSTVWMAWLHLQAWAVTPEMLCIVQAQLIAQSIGQAFQVAYAEFLRANGIDDPNLLKDVDYQEVLNQQQIFGEELSLFSSNEKQKEVGGRFVARLTFLLRRCFEFSVHLCFQTQRTHSIAFEGMEITLNLVDLSLPVECWLQTTHFHLQLSSLSALFYAATSVFV